MLGSQTFISFKEDTHQYFDPDGNEYSSVSKVNTSVTPAFDRNGISMIMAGIKAKADGMTVQRAQQIILQDWDHKRDSAIARGNWIHDNLEQYLLSGKCDDKLIHVGKRMASFVSPYYKYFSEALIYIEQYNVAGQADLVVQRQKNKNGVFDFYDFKTNESKGIYYDSIKREANGKIKKHYNRFLYSPVEHLEHSNYNIYSLQLSLYAFMASVTFNIKVGQLAILFIDENLNIRRLPVAYLKYEVMALLDAYQDRNKSGWDE